MPYALTEAALASVDADLRRLAGRWPNFWPGRDLQRAVIDVHARLLAAAHAWELRDVEPLSGGVVALVCTATQPRRPVIVKVSPRIPGGEGLCGEGEAMLFWRHTGAVAEVLGRRDDGFTLLLERLQPGDMSQDAGLSVAQMLTELGQLARTLHAAGRPPEPYSVLRAANARRRGSLAGYPDLQVELDRLHSAGESGADERCCTGTCTPATHYVTATDGRSSTRTGSAATGTPRSNPLLGASDGVSRRPKLRPRTRARLGANLRAGCRHGPWPGGCVDAHDRPRRSLWMDVLGQLDAAEVAWVAGLHRLADALGD